MTTTCLILLISTFSASAQTVLTETTPAPATASSDNGESHNTLVATVFGEPLYLEPMTPAEAEVKRQELPPQKFNEWLRGHQAARVYDKIWAAVSRRYIERETLEVTEEELDAITKSAERSLKSISGGANDSPFPSEVKNGMTVAVWRASHMDWKVCKSLYEKYGGRVGVGSLGSWVALDGQHALLQEHLKAGDIRFHHAEIEKEFWKYARRDRFADAYPHGDNLMRLLATPPYLRALATAPVDPKKRERIGSALGRDVFRDELKDKPPTYHQVVQLFMAPAMEEFEREHWADFEMTDDEVRAGVAWTEAERKRQGGAAWEHWQARSTELQAKAAERLTEIQRSLEDPATREEERPFLKSALRVAALDATHPHAGEVWFMSRRRKLEQYLFDHYGGGRIIHQQFGPEALDARRKLLLELEAAGKFEITDPELRKLAYDYWERPNHPGGFHTDRRLLEFPWTSAHQEIIRR